jgi:hypothetical protein
MPDPRATLSALLASSGLTVSRFARDVVGRDVRTVRRWIAGDPIPDSVAQWLERATVTMDPAVVHIVVRTRARRVTRA